MRPAHWSITGTHWNEYELSVTDDHLDGHRVAALRCTVDEPSGFGAQVQTFEAGPFRGQRLRFSARLRAEDVTGWAGLWMRVDGPASDRRRQLAFYNNEDRGLTGTTDWVDQDAVLDVAPAATVILIGAILSGKGTLFLADFAVRTVSAAVPVTVQPQARTGPLPQPTNLSFEHVEEATPPAG